MNNNFVKSALVTRLTADATLTAMLADGTAGVHDGLAKQGAGSPHIVFFKPSGIPSYTMGQHAYDDQLWTIRVTTTGPSALVAGSIVARVDSLLDDQPLTLSGLTNLSLRRAADIPDYPEVVEGVRYNHQGATYRLFIS